MPKIQKKKIEQCTKIFIYRDLNFLFLVLFLESVVLPVVGSAVYFLHDQSEKSDKIRTNKASLCAVSVYF